MKNNKTQMALIVASALLSFAQAHAETVSITTQFTILENLSAEERLPIQMRVEKENPYKKIDWENVIMGKNENGQTEIRDKKTLILLAHIEPTCS